MKILWKTVVLSVWMCFMSCKEKKESSPTTEDINAQNEVIKEDAAKTILFFGTSLTAGLGLDLSEAYPALIQQKIDSLGYDYQIVNSGLSGDTSASALNRIGWVLTPETDILVLEMGANDGLRGIPLDETKRNLQSIIDRAREQNPNVEILLAGMQMPPNMGPDYTSRFKNLFPDLARENQLSLVPFLLEGVGGVAELNQPDGIHPTAEGQQILAQNTWAVLKTLLNQEK